MNAVHNGADDNASGVALMRGLANELSRSQRYYNFLFIAYGAHELGLHGSSFFFKHSKKYKKIEVMSQF